VVLAIIALGVFAPPPLARATLILAMLVAAAYWVIGEDLGGIFTGQGTDPNRVSRLTSPRRPRREPGRWRWWSTRSPAESRVGVQGGARAPIWCSTRSRWRFARGRQGVVDLSGRVHHSLIAGPVHSSGSSPGGVRERR
jgi:hypothetical protein